MDREITVEPCQTISLQVAQTIGIQKRKRFAHAGQLSLLRSGPGINPAWTSSPSAKHNGKFHIAGLPQAVFKTTSFTRWRRETSGVTVSRIWRGHGKAKQRIRAPADHDEEYGGHKMNRASKVRAF